MCLESAVRIPQFCISRSQCCLAKLSLCPLFLCACLFCLAFDLYRHASTTVSFLMRVSFFMFCFKFYLPSPLRIFRCLTDILRLSGAVSWVKSSSNCLRTKILAQWSLILGSYSLHYVGNLWQMEHVSAKLGFDNVIGNDLYHELVPLQTRKKAPPS